MHLFLCYSTQLGSELLNDRLFLFLSVWHKERTSNMSPQLRKKIVLFCFVLIKDFPSFVLDGIWWSSVSSCHTAKPLSSCQEQCRGKKPRKGCELMSDTMRKKHNLKAELSFPHFCHYFCADSYLSVLL